jgi:Sulfocyanin (SoxE) domain
MIKTDIDIDKLPRTIDGQQLDEKKLGKVWELGDLKPGATKKSSVKLEPGTYLLFCNLSGHTDLGMYSKLVVTAKAAAAPAAAKPVKAVATQKATNKKVDEKDAQEGGAVEKPKG